MTSERAESSKSTKCIRASKRGPQCQCLTDHQKKELSISSGAHKACEDSRQSQLSRKQSCSYRICLSHTGWACMQAPGLQEPHPSSNMAGGFGTRKGDMRDQAEGCEGFRVKVAKPERPSLALLEMWLCTMSSRTASPKSCAQSTRACPSNSVTCRLFTPSWPSTLPRPQGGRSFIYCPGKVLGLILVCKIAFQSQQVVCSEGRVSRPLQASSILNVP